MNGTTQPAYYCISADSPNGQNDDVPENNLKCFNRAEDLQLAIYPNPLRDELTVDLFSAESQNVQVKLFNQQGDLVKVLMDQTIPSGLTRLSSHLTAEAAGIYTLRITYRNRVIHRQIIKN
jgi:hypothetical protein